MIGDAMGFNPIRKFTAMQMTEWSDEKFNNYLLEAMKCAEVFAIGQSASIYVVQNNYMRRAERFGAFFVSKFWVLNVPHNYTSSLISFATQSFRLCCDTHQYV